MSTQDVSKQIVRQIWEGKDLLKLYTFVIYNYDLYKTISKTRTAGRTEYKDKYLEALTAYLEKERSIEACSTRIFHRDERLKLLAEDSGEFQDLVHKRSLKEGKKLFDVESPSGDAESKIVKYLQKKFPEDFPPKNTPSGIDEELVKPFSSVREWSDLNLVQLSYSICKNRKNFSKVILSYIGEMKSSTQEQDVMLAKRISSSQTSLEAEFNSQKKDYLKLVQVFGAQHDKQQRSKPPQEALSIPAPDDSMGHFLANVDDSDHRDGQGNRDILDEDIPLYD